MNITSYNLSSYYYKLYDFMNTEAYQTYAVDSSEVSEETYNIEDMTSALEALNNLDEVDFSSIGSVSSYANNFYTLSQLSIDGDTSLASFLSGDTDMSAIYDNLASINSLSEEDLESLVSSTSKVSNYASFLNDTLNTVDESV